MIGQIVKKNIKHLKNQKRDGFKALGVSEIMEINDLGEKNIF